MQPLRAALPSTGVPPDTQIFVDDLSVGRYFGRAGGTVLALGCQYSTAATRSGTAALPLALELEQADGRRDAVLALMRKGFQRCDPNRSLEHFVHTQVATSSGDGALSQGGRRTTTRAPVP